MSRIYGIGHSFGHVLSQRLIQNDTESAIEASRLYWLPNEVFMGTHA